MEGVVKKGSQAAVEAELAKVKSTAGTLHSMVLLSLILRPRRQSCDEDFLTIQGQEFEKDRNRGLLKVLKIFLKISWSDEISWLIFWMI